jgi:site-specific DNA-methyltransferase (adenine-specific)/modification methylase
MAESIEAGIIDMVFADPPYNLSGKPLNLTDNTTGGPYYKMNESWDTFGHESYAAFTLDWLTAARRVLKETGSLYVCCTMHNIGEIITTSKALELSLKNILTWYKTNAMPSVTKRTFTHSTEYVCWFVAGTGWTFNYSQVKEINPVLTKSGESKQMRDFLDFIEMPIVQGKNRLKDSNGRALHPTQKPEQLVEIALIASSNPGDTVLDPFIGSGTTAVVAERLGRRWIGIENHEPYIQAAMKRVNGVRQHD